MSERKHMSKVSSEMSIFLDETDSSDSNNQSDINEFQGIAEELAGRDFSKNSNKEHVYDRTIAKLGNQGREKRIKKINKKVIATAASLLIVGAAFSQMSFAKTLADRIINSIDMGSIKVVQIVVDKSQLELAKAKKDKVNDNQQAEIVTETDASKLKGKTSFNVKFPKYLPSAYQFEKAEFYKNGALKINKDYININFVDQQTKKVISLQQRATRKDAAYYVSTDESIESVKVNGLDAVFIGERTISWEANKTFYLILGNGNVSKGQLVKIAESIK